MAWSCTELLCNASCHMYLQALWLLSQDRSSVEETKAWLHCPQEHMLADFPTILLSLCIYLSTDHVQNMPVNSFTSHIQMCNNSRKWLCVWYIPVEQQTSFIPHGERAAYFITTVLTQATLKGRELMRQCHRHWKITCVTCVCKEKHSKKYWIGTLTL